MSNDKITEAYSEALESADVIPMTSEELFRLGWQAALTQQPESEPAEYQHRMRPVWDAAVQEPWTIWENCPRETYEECKDTRFIGEWEHEVRELYTIPQPSAQVPEWTDDQCIQFISVAMRHVEYAEGSSMTLDDVRLGVKFALKAAPSIAEKREWIRCEERLPTEEDSDAEEKVWAICRGGHWLHTAHWETVATEYSRENFTHWMPTGLQRPEPPEKGQ